MKINDHSLRQLDEAYVTSLDEAALRGLSLRLLADLKEARERLNQNSGNSSRPPSSQAPWDTSSVLESEALKAAREVEEADGEGPEPGEEAPKEEARRAEPAPPSPRRAGKPVGAPGHGRPAPERVDGEALHIALECSGCGQSLSGLTSSAYTGHYEVDLVREAAGWTVRWTRHLWHETGCPCGHLTRAEPPRWQEDGVALGGFRLIGPGLAALIVALALRYRLSRARIREFLADWFGVSLSVGALHAVIEEAGAAVAPVEAELIQAVQASGLLHADETPWPERGVCLWLWVFTAAHVTLYSVSHRGQELVRNLLEGFAGVLMSDGWQAYRWQPRRLRCWAHLKRKAVGLTESFSPEAQTFGGEVLALWKTLWEAVQAARDGPPHSLRSEWSERLGAFRTRCETHRDSPHVKTRELAREFLNDWEAIFAVLDDPRGPLTNNAAERALRHWVILRRITHGTRTERGSRQLALLASVIDTCRQRGHSPWDYLRATFTRRRQGLAVLPLPVAGGE